VGHGLSEPVKEQLETVLELTALVQACAAGGSPQRFRTLSR